MKTNLKQKKQKTKAYVLMDVEEEEAVAVFMGKISLSEAIKIHLQDSGFWDNNYYNDGNVELTGKQWHAKKKFGGFFRMTQRPVWVTTNATALSGKIVNTADMESAFKSVSLAVVATMAKAMGIEPGGVPLDVDLRKISSAPLVKAAMVLCQLYDYPKPFGLIHHEKTVNNMVRAICEWVVESRRLALAGMPRVGKRVLMFDQGDGKRILNQHSEEPACVRLTKAFQDPRVEDVLYPENTVLHRSCGGQYVEEGQKLGTPCVTSFSLIKDICDVLEFPEG